MIIISILDLDTNTDNKYIYGDSDVYDIIVIGGGPAGYTAALYTTRAGLKTVVLEQLSAGGQLAQTNQVDNYPGFENGIDGFTLGDKMRIGAERFGAKTLLAKALSVELTGNIKKIRFDNGYLYSKAVIVATGANPRKLGLDGEMELTGNGVSYCASCDGMFYRDKTVVVVGGGNSAVEDAIILSRICKKVILVHRRDILRATKIYRDSIMKSKNVIFYRNTVVNDFISDSRLTGVKVKNLHTEKIDNIDCDGVFISIGRTPATELVKGQLILDSAGYIIAGESTETNLPGVFAAGDVRTKTVRQIATAVSDGAVAAYYAEEYLVNNV